MSKLNKNIKSAKWGSDRSKIARDIYPGTEFDGFFLDISDARNPGNKAEDQKQGRGFLTWVGECMADLISKGESNFLRAMADALDKWKRHKPSPDNFKVAFVENYDAVRRLKRKVSVREIIKRLPAYGITIDENTP